MDLRRVIRWKSLLLAVTLAFTIAYAGQARAGGGARKRLCRRELE